MIYIVSEYASQGEIFGECSFTLRLSTFSCHKFSIFSEKPGTEKCHRDNHETFLINRFLINFTLQITLQNMGD